VNQKFRCLGHGVLDDDRSKCYKWWTSNVLVGELDVDDVVAGLRWRVLDLACTVGVVLALNVRLTRSFHGQTQTAEPCQRNRRLLANVNSLLCCRPSVCRLSVGNARAPYSGVVSFGNFSTALGTWAIHWHPLKISRRSSQGNPSAVRVKHKRGSKI